MATNPGSGKIAQFVNSVNKDPHARIQFLLNPAEALQHVGIQLSDDVKAELKEVVHEYLRKFPAIAMLPTGVSHGREASAAAALAEAVAERVGMYVV
jgi:hypothetical protein